jgi:formylmethanofuran dehydrogenase subunit D
MDLQSYFNTHEGMGVLATASCKGDVDAALYAIPHVVDNTTIGLIMRPRLSYENVLSNPKATYLFIEKGPGYKGVRLYLKKSGEEKDMDKVNSLRRSHHGGDEASAVLVYFTVEHTRPLVGDHE